jgi:hypothetical protein
MTNNDKPLVSVGMPVYNGERYIREALDSLLAQHYENFELNISDNASSDRTEEICRSYCAMDNRVRYHRNPRNIGSTPNWHRALKLASGKYFMWAACDDCWSANYMGTLLEHLLARPSAVLAAGKTLYIDGNGNRRATEPDDAPTRYPNVHVGTAKQLLQQHAAGWLHGVYRKDSLLVFLPTFLTAPPLGDDIVLLLEICLAREVIGSDAAIMYKRVTTTNNSKLISPKTPRETVKWQCRYAWALTRVILNSPLSANEKADMLQTCALYLGRRYFPRGVTPWLKTWIKAGFNWSIGIDRP